MVWRWQYSEDCGQTCGGCIFPWLHILDYLSFLVPMLYSNGMQQTQQLTIKCAAMLNDNNSLTSVTASKLCLLNLDQALWLCNV